MKLCEILNYFNIDSNNETVINSLVFNMNDIKKDSLYLLLKTKDIKNLNKILKKKPVAILSIFELKETIFIKDLKEKLTPLFLFFYKIDFSKINIIAITGTEMKSSIAKLLFDALNMANRKSLLLSSSFEGDNIITTELTTPQGNDLVKYLSFAIENNYENFIFEASSISVEEFRLNGIIINEVILTNLKVDHLDYHKTIANYYNSKCKILKMSKKIYAKDEEINKLDEKFEYVKIKENKIINKKILFKNKEYFFTNLNSYHLNAMQYILTYLNENKIEVDISNITYPEGRFDVVLNKPMLVIDYAHSSSAFNNVCKYFTNLIKGKKIIVFGAGGEREIDKRPLYGKIAYELFDIAIVSEDNSRFESFKKIKNDIISINPKFFKVIKNRKKAIKYAFSLLNNYDDGILFVGKGIEKYIKIKNKRIPYNEKEYVISLINKYF